MPTSVEQLAASYGVTDLLIPLVSIISVIVFAQIIKRLGSSITDQVSKYRATKVTIAASFLYGVFYKLEEHAHGLVENASLFYRICLYFSLWFFGACVHFFPRYCHILATVQEPSKTQGSLYPNTAIGSLIASICSIAIAPYCRMLQRTIFGYRYPGLLFFTAIHVLFLYEQQSMTCDPQLITKISANVLPGLDPLLPQDLIMGIIGPIQLFPFLLALMFITDITRLVSVLFVSFGERNSNLILFGASVLAAQEIVTRAFRFVHNLQILYLWENIRAYLLIWMAILVYRLLTSFLWVEIAGR